MALQWSKSHQDYSYPRIQIPYNIIRDLPTANRHSRCSIFKLKCIDFQPYGVWCVLENWFNCRICCSDVHSSRTSILLIMDFYVSELSNAERRQGNSITAASFLHHTYLL